VKYTAKDRRDAILICQIAASGGACRPVAYGRGYVMPGEIGKAIGASEAAIGLARDAWCCAQGSTTHSIAESDAEAALMLEEGWSPGKPTVRLGGAR
jgi:hypothetical protein